MWTSFPPFSSLEPHEVRQRITNNIRPDFPSNLPENLTNFLDVCLEWRPKLRPSATELIEHEYLQWRAPKKEIGLIVNEAYKIANGGEDDEEDYDILSDDCDSY